MKSPQVFQISPKGEVVASCNWCEPCDLDDAIQLSYSDRSGICVIMDPRYVSSLAINTLKTIVRSSPSVGVRFEDPAHLGRRKFVGQFELNAYLHGLLDCKTTCLQRFHQWELNHTHSLVPPSIKRVLEQYRFNNAKSSNLVFEIVHRFSPAQRYAVFDVDYQSGTFRVGSSAANLRTAGTNWFAKSVGQPLVRFPDRAYADWTMRTYRQVCDLRHPLLHNVASEILWRNGRSTTPDFIRLCGPVFGSNGRITQILAIMDDPILPHLA